MTKSTLKHYIVFSRENKGKVASSRYPATYSKGGTVEKSSSPKCVPIMSGVDLYLVKPNEYVPCYKGLL